MVEGVLLISASALIGSMLFFAIVVAPIVFKTLPGVTAGHFLRALFPRYYNWGLVLTLIGLSAAFAVSKIPIMLLAAVATLLLYAKYSLMPEINASRDAGLSGDAGANRRFSHLHRRSVVINGLQIIALSAVIAHVTLL